MWVPTTPKTSAGENQIVTDYITESSLRIARPLYELVRDEVLPGTGIASERLWRAFADLLHALGPTNQALLEKRVRLQNDIDAWHRARPGAHRDLVTYKAYLAQIGYLEPAAGACRIETENVDPEIARTAGPQLVVPLNNARYALNAANARWGSLYDALYGTDVIPTSGGQASGESYNPVRGAAVMRYAAEFLDTAIPLAGARHADVTSYSLVHGESGTELVIGLPAGTHARLHDDVRFVGFRERDTELVLLFRHHGLHVELQIDSRHPVGAAHPAAIKDVVLEAAVTTIQDCEDSVAAVDAADKTLVYRNWLGLMQGTLEERFEKAGRTLTRRLRPDREFLDPDGNPLTLPGRSLMLVRNVGLHMNTDAVLTGTGKWVPEGMLDALITSLIGRRDLEGSSGFRNSRTGSIYIVKPKLHGPEEVAFTVTLLEHVERILGIQPNTLKLGIMDEERRTSVNLPACIRAAPTRLIFINTGFLDRTGDEIHTSMEAGAVVRKAAMRSQPWMTAYEQGNMAAGLACGLPGRAQIGKGMWARPDRMADMLAEKIEHPKSGASTAWVPSPTAATLHALHYHRVDVTARQAALAGGRPAITDDLLRIPIMTSSAGLTAEDVQRELDNNAQGILGYVVRWIDQGIGCSKVPDIDQVGLMEDRATLRISSQHVANWLLHGVVTQAQVVESFRRMALLVDRQNASDPAYSPMAPDYDGEAFGTALDLVLKGRDQPNGYTEPLLHAGRRRRKLRGP